MLQEFIKIDESGYKVDVVLLDDEVEEIPFDCVKGWGSDTQLFRPRFDIGLQQWVEEKSQEEFLEEARLLKMQELNEACEFTIFGRFVATVRGVQYQFSNDVEAQMNFDKTDRAFDKARIVDVTWTCYDMQGNVQRLVMNQEEFEVVYVAHLSHITGNIERFRDQLAPLVQEAKSVEDLGNIKWEEDTPISDSSSLK